MGKVINVLMKRDGMSRSEASLLVRQTMDEVNACLVGGDLQGAEDVFCDGLGLEPDYLLEAII